jgi:segregation and condensation protein B
MTSREELEAAIEAILFVATEPVATERLHALFTDDDRAAVEAALQAVIARYPGGEAQGLVADFAAGGVRLVTRPALQGYLRKFFQVTGRTKLSMAALETLAIVAYRQPITGPEIQELRGVSTAGVLKTLLDHRLIRISGRKEVVGKPFLYSTSREFLVRFGLNRLQDLPPLEELEQMLQSQVEAEGEGQATEQRSLELALGEPDPEAELDRAFPSARARSTLWTAAPTWSGRTRSPTTCPRTRSSPPWLHSTGARTTSVWRTSDAGRSLPPRRTRR